MQYVCPPHLAYRPIHASQVNIQISKQLAINDSWQSQIWLLQKQQNIILPQCQLATSSKYYCNCRIGIANDSFFFQKYNCYFPKIYLLLLISFTMKVYARINTFKISFVRSQPFTHFRTKHQWYITNLLTYLNRISRVKEILPPLER